MEESDSDSDSSNISRTSSTSSTDHDHEHDHVAVYERHDTAPTTLTVSQMTNSQAYDSRYDSRREPEFYDAENRLRGDKQLCRPEIVGPLKYLAFIVTLLIVILVPLSFSYVDYYEYGLHQRKSTGKVDTSKVYDSGRYFLGPDYTFLKYKADAHQLHLKDLAVFSSSGGSNESIGLEFVLEVSLTYLLRKESIGQLHKDLASSYKAVIESRAKDAIKNEAIFITFNEFFQARMAVENRLRIAVQKRWNEKPALHCDLDQFHVGRIQIPEAVARKQLETKLQNERNDRESYLQQAQVERELTAVDVNAVLLEKEKVLRTARAEASLVKAKAKAEAEEMILNAQNEGFKLLFNAANITAQKHKLALDYLRGLRLRTNKTDIGVSYLTEDTVLKTKAV